MKNFSRALVVAAIVLGGLASAYASKKDAFSSSTSLGPNMALQAFQVSHRILQNEEEKTRFFFPKDAGKETVPPKLRETGLGWTAAYALGLLRGPALDEIEQPGPNTYSNLSHNIMGGLNWAFLPRWEASLDGVYSLIKGENVQQGGMFTHIEYTAPLTPRHEVTEEVPVAKKAKIIAPPENQTRKLAEPITYPNVRVGLDFHFITTIHNPEYSEADSRSPRQVRVYERTRISSYGTGGTVTYESDPNFSFGLGLMKFHYGGDYPDQFFKYYDVGPQNARGSMNLGGISGHIGEMLNFPVWHVTETFAWDTTDGSAFELILSQTTYLYGTPPGTDTLTYNSPNVPNVATTPPSFGISPVYYKALSERWNAGFGAELVFTSGAINLLGSFQLSRYF